MSKFLPIFPAILFLFFLMPGSVSAASSINLTNVISTSKSNHSPLGDCTGPDKKHLQTTKEVCEALSKAWGKGSGSFNVGVPTSNPPTPILSVTTALEDSQAKRLPTGDCVGPDKKHFQTTSEVCEALNKTWGKNNISFNLGVPSPIAPTTSVADAIIVSEANQSPSGDCTGPDKKHLQATKEVCEALNHNWGKSAVAFTPGVTPLTGSASGGSSSTASGNSNSASSGPTNSGKGSDKPNGSSSTSTNTINNTSDSNGASSGPTNSGKGSKDNKSKK